MPGRTLAVLPRIIPGLFLRGILMRSLHAFLVLFLAAFSLAAADPQEVRYGFLFAGNRAGEAVSRVEAGGERVYTFEFNDRGRGPKTSTRVRLDGNGLPTFVE